MDSMKVSVVVPVYKVERYLSECVDSIIGQTYKNLEIILVDDGSPDKCGEMCEEYAEKDNRIVVVHKENGGLASARNAGLKVMHGDFVTFVDSDDWIHETMIEILIKLMEKNQADVVQVGFSRNVEDIHSNVGDILNAEVIYGEDNIKNYSLDRILRPEACAKLYKAKLFKEIRFNENIKYAEDLEFGLRFYKTVKKSVISSDRLYFYRQNDGSLTAFSLNEGRLKEAGMIMTAAQREINTPWLYECMLFRSIRCGFAILNRIVSEQREDLYGNFRTFILTYKKDIIKNQYLGAKYKVGVIALKLCKTFKQYATFVSMRK